MPLTRLVYTKLKATFTRNSKSLTVQKTQIFKLVVKQHEYQTQSAELHARKKALLKIQIYLNVGELLFTIKTLHLFLLWFLSKLPQCQIIHLNGSCSGNIAVIKISTAEGTGSSMVIQGKECLKSVGLGKVDTGCSRDWYRKTTVTNIYSSCNKYLTKTHLFQRGNKPKHKELTVFTCHVSCKILNRERKKNRTI